jgi:ribose transport system substrate-binding protein
MFAKCHLVPLLTVSAMLAAFSGCGGSQHEPDEKYFLIASNTKVAYWKLAIAGLNRAGTQLNIKAEVAGPADYDPKAQHEAFQKVLQSKPTGILISAGDSKLIQPDIDAAIAQGVPVITIDSDVENSKRLLFIGTDNYKAGTIGAHVVAKELQGKGNVAVFTMPTQPNLAERLRGYEDTFVTQLGIRVTRVVDTRGESTLAFDGTKEILDAGSGKVDAFVCLESTSCAEVADVLNRRHVLHKVVVAMDTDPRTLEWIQQGVITATIGQKPYTMAYFGLRMLDDLHHHKPGTWDKKWSQDAFSPIPAFVDTGATLIDKTNVDSFLRNLRSETKD